MEIKGKSDSAKINGLNIEKNENDISEKKIVHEIEENINNSNQEDQIISLREISNEYEKNDRFFSKLKSKGSFKKNHYKNAHILKEIYFSKYLFAKHAKRMLKARKG